jgi:putative transcription factor
MDKECPICGGIIWGKGERVLIEGAKITVCRGCAQHGTKLQIKNQLVNRATYNRKEPRKKPSKTGRKYQNILDESEIIVSDYASRIRKARTARKLTQEQFAQKLNEKPSLLRRIEAGKVEPTIKLAKKIENVYSINLLEKNDKLEINEGKSKYMKKSQGSSLGDIAFIKKKSS